MKPLTPDTEPVPIYQYNANAMDFMIINSIKELK